jgi:hypothetical protein
MYEGRTVRGLPRTVASRGRVLVENREFVGDGAPGQYMHRSAPGKPMPLAQP